MTISDLSSENKGEKKKHYSNIGIAFGSERRNTTDERKEEKEREKLPATN